MYNSVTPELLAPVGSVQSFFAAIENGADAVFCGLKRFSARAKAKNFSLEELALLIGYCHRHNKKIYVALNTLIKEEELAELAEILCELLRLGVDGLIIQDSGLYHLVHEYFPEIPLHASTQMVVHNLAGVKVLEGLGFERVVLARELSLAEIEFISCNSNIEIEHFIHGALCYSMSGHCLFSSYLDGRSGNRGRCGQPCRRRYHHHGKAGFYFSTSDFTSLELIPELARAGVMSFKIEGRMKSAEYVASVVSAYRTVIDSRVGSEKDAIAVAREKLGGAMGRKGCQGFLSGKGGGAIVRPEQKGGIGAIIGRVERLQGGKIYFTTSESFFVGDRLRIQPGNDRGGQGFTVRKLILGKRSVKRVSSGSMATIPIPPKARFQVGDVVFKLGSGKAFTMSEEACRRRLNGANAVSLEFDVSVSCCEENSQFSVQGTLCGTQLVMVEDYPVEMIPADRTPLSRETLLKVFSHTGHPLLRLRDFTVGKLPAVVVKPSRIKAVRREFYAKFAEQVDEWQWNEGGLRVKRLLEKLPVPVFVKSSEETTVQLYVETDDPADIAILAGYPQYHFILTLGRILLNEEKKQELASLEEKSRLVWDVPSIIFDEQWQGHRAMVEELVAMGFERFRINNIAHFDMFRSFDKIQLIAGSWLNTLNSQSVLTLREQGCSLFTFVLEDDRENIFALLDRVEAEELLLTVYGRVDLFTSRIPFPVHKKRSDFESNNGDLFHLEKTGEVTVTRAAKPFSLLGEVTELQQRGCCNFILDLRGTGFVSAAGQKVVDAFHSTRPLAGTVRMNYNRGLA